MAKAPEFMEIDIGTGFDSGPAFISFGGKRKRQIEYTAVFIDEDDEKIKGVKGYFVKHILLRGDIRCPKCKEKKFKVKFLNPEPNDIIFECKNCKSDFNGWQAKS